MKSIRNYLMLLGLLASRVWAKGGELSNPVGDSATFQSVVDSIIDGLLKLAIPIVAIMVIIGGFMIMTAGGNSEKVTTGKNVILYAVIGYAVILMAQAVVSILKSIIG